MAKYKSLFKVSGDIGDVNMYQDEGNKYMRETTSLDRERIMTDPKFRRTRENMVEFGGAALVAKSLRDGLSAVAKRFGDRRMGSRFIGKFKKMIRQASGVRGQRPIQLVTYKHFLEGMTLHRTTSLGAVFTLPVVLTPNSLRNGVTIDIPAINPDVDLTIPQGATHFKLLLQIVAISEHIYDASIEGYTPFTAAINGAKDLVATSELPLIGPPTLPMQLTANLPNAPTMIAGDALVVCVGVEFYQWVAPSYYILESGNAMDILKVF